MHIRIHLPLSRQASLISCVKYFIWPSVNRTAWKQFHDIQRLLFLHFLNGLLWFFQLLVCMHTKAGTRGSILCNGGIELFRTVHRSLPSSVGKKLVCLSFNYLERGSTKTAWSRLACEENIYFQIILLDLSCNILDNWNINWQNLDDLSVNCQSSMLHISTLKLRKVKWFCLCIFFLPPVRQITDQPGSFMSLASACESYLLGIW